MLDLVLRLRSAIVLELFEHLECPGCLECLCKLRELLRTLEIGFTLRSFLLCFSVDGTQQAFSPSLQPLSFLCGFIFPALEFHCVSAHSQRFQLLLDVRDPNKLLTSSLPSLLLLDSVAPPTTHNCLFLRLSFAMSSPWLSFPSLAISLVSPIFTSSTQCCNLCCICDTCAPVLHGLIHVCFFSSRSWTFFLREMRTTSLDLDYFLELHLRRVQHPHICHQLHRDLFATSSQTVSRTLICLFPFSRALLLLLLRVCLFLDSLLLPLLLREPNIAKPSCLHFTNFSYAFGPIFLTHTTSRSDLSNACVSDLLLPRVLWLSLATTSVALSLHVLFPLCQQTSESSSWRFKLDPGKRVLEISCDPLTTSSSCELGTSSSRLPFLILSLFASLNEPPATRVGTSCHGSTPRHSTAVSPLSAATVVSLPPPSPSFPSTSSRLEHSTRSSFLWRVSSSL